MIRGQYLPCSRPILLLSLLAHLIYQLKTTTQKDTSMISISYNVARLDFLTLRDTLLNSTKE